MARLVVGDQALLIRPKHDRPAEAKHRPLDRFVEVHLCHLILAFLRGDQGRLVGDVAQVGANEARGGAGDVVEIDTRSQAKIARVDFQDRLAANPVGRGDGDPPVEPPGTQQRGIEDFGAVGGGEHHDVLVRREAVHLGQDLVERLLAFIVGAEAGRRGARAPDGVQLVDEDDAWGGGLGFGEEIANAGGAHADDGLDELRGRKAEEGAVRFAGHRSGEQRLARTRWANQQDAVRNLRAEPLIFFWCLEKVHDLGQVLLGLIDPGDVGKGSLRSGVGSVELCATLAEGPQNPTGTGRCHSPAQVEQPADQQQGGPETDQQAQQR